MEEEGEQRNQEKEEEEEEEEAKKEEVRSNALSYTYRLRGWRRSEYRREAGKMSPKKKYKNNISTDAQSTNICLKTGYVFQKVPGKVCVWNCHFANICKLLSSEFLVLAQYD